MIMDTHGMIGHVLGLLEMDGWKLYNGPTTMAIHGMTGHAAIVSEI